MSPFDEALPRIVMSSRATSALQLFLLLFSLSLAVQPTVFAQGESDVDVIRVRTDLVTVPAYVTDANGRRVENLKLADFELSDDGQVVKVDYFVAGSERVALLFALDASGSTREAISQQRDTAVALFSRFGKDSEVAVMRFAETAKMIVPFSRDSGAAISAFDLPVPTNERTAIFDAVADAIEAFDPRRINAAERRIIILISDGLDTMSATKPGNVINAATRAGISIYAIQLPLYTPRDGRLRPRPASKGFRELAEKSGGRYFLAGDAKSALASKPTYDLAPIFQAIEADLRGQYLFGYYPVNTTQDARSRRIDLKLVSADKRKLRVRLLRTDYSSVPNALSDSRKLGGADN